MGFFFLQSLHFVFYFFVFCFVSESEILQFIFKKQVKRYNIYIIYIYEIARFLYDSGLKMVEVCNVKIDTNVSTLKCI